MATVNCWTLWQRMPPRYQLTTKDLNDDQQEWKAVLADIPRTPRLPKSNCKSRSPERPRVSFAGIAPHTSDERLRFFVESRKQAFPSRRSVYINNLKQQQRVNSAKQQLIADPSIVSYTPTMRAQTAPQFPVTNLSNLESFDRNHNPDPRTYIPGKFLPVQNVTPFNNSVPKHRRKERLKHYVVNPTDNATMFIDNDKILYFRKNKLDVTQSCNDTGAFSHKRDEASYIACLRKEYLRAAKFIPKERTKERVVKGLDKERIDYDRRVCHILDYYAKGENPNSKNDNRSDNETCDVHSRERVHTDIQTSFLTSRSAHSPKSGRLRSLLTGPNPTNQSRGTSPQISESFEEWHTYLKMNAQSVLHDREFLLQTADGRVVKRLGNITRNDINSCKCQMCRIEMELSLTSKTSRSLDMNESQTMSKGSNDQLLHVHDHKLCSVRTNSENVNLNDGETKQVDIWKRTEETKDGKEKINCLDKESRKEAGHISITLPDVQEERKPDSDRAPHNSPVLVPVEIPVADEQD